MGTNVLLISVQSDLEVIGLRSLHHQLIRQGYASHILFIPGFDPATRFDAVYDLVGRLSPLFVGISLMSVEFDRAARLSRALKSRFPSLPIIWGGIHPTIAPETCLDHADYAFVGEGEPFIADFAEALANGRSPETLGGLAYRKDGRLVRNPLVPLVQDLSALPAGEHVPRDSFVLHRQAIAPLDLRAFRTHARYAGTTYSIMSSRGCPFACTYCCNNALSKIYGSVKIRFMDHARIIEELRAAIDRYPFIEYVNFQDDCFLARSDADMGRFCHLYRQAIRRPFIIRSIPTFITERKVDALKAAGLAWISLGLQSGSDHVCRDVYRRRSGRRDFLEAARIIKSRDLAAFYDVILDNPFETDEERLETVTTLMATPKPFYTQYFSLSLYPGTELRSRALAEGLITGDEYRSKDYLLYGKTGSNHLVRLATFLPAAWMTYLLGHFRRNPGSRWFKFNLAVARLASIAVAEPLTYLKVIRLSQRKRWGATLRVIPFYLKEGIARFMRQFR